MLPLYKFALQHLCKFFYIITGIVLFPEQTVLPGDRLFPVAERNPADRSTGIHRLTAVVHRRKTLTADHPQTGFLQIFRIQKFPLETDDCPVIILFDLSLFPGGDENTGIFFSSWGVADGSAAMGFLAEISAYILLVVRTRLTYSSENALR